MNIGKNQDSEDSSLLGDLRAGGERARRFVSEYAPRLLHFFLSLGAESKSAEDLTQEVFYKLLKTKAQYDERGQSNAYLFRMAYHVWVDSKRVRTPQAVEKDDCFERLLDQAESPLDRLIRWEEECSLDQGLNELPAEQRIVFELGVIQGLRYREIAQVLNIPLGTVKSRIFTAAQKLKERCGPSVERR